MTGLRPHALLSFASVALFLAMTSVSIASDWKVLKVGSREYLSADNIARFYGFPENLVPVGKTIRLDNGRQSLDLKLDSREALINGVRNWLSFPVVGHEGKFLVSRVDLAKTIEPQLRPQLIPNLGKVKTVVLDPGHGGFDKGAASGYGREKEYALDVARQLRPLLQAKGFKVIMTRESDVFVPLQVRARIANATRDSIFVSIHFNATNRDPHANGFEIFSLTPRGAPSTSDDGLALSFMNVQNGSAADAPSVQLSSSVFHSMLGCLPQFDRGIKRARFAVLRLTKIPAILVEGGFLTERGDSRLIENKEWRGKLAGALCTGIESYRNLAEKKQRPMLLADFRRKPSIEIVAYDPSKPMPNSSPAPPVIPASN